MIMRRMIKNNTEVTKTIKKYIVLFAVSIENLKNLRNIIHLRKHISSFYYLQ